MQIVCIKYNFYNLINRALRRSGLGAPAVFVAFSSLGWRQV